MGGFFLKEWNDVSGFLFGPLSDADAVVVVLGWLS